ncbi:MAG TPA: helix-turn-helix transcriptional regulator [Kutzneria sp.]
MAASTQEDISTVVALVQTTQDLGALLRKLLRETGGGAITYRDVAKRTGWSHATCGNYLNGRTLASRDRFAVLVDLFDIPPRLRRELLAARDRVEDLRRGHTRPSESRPDVLVATCERSAELAEVTRTSSGSEVLTWLDGAVRELAASYARESADPILGRLATVHLAAVNLVHAKLSRVHTRRLYFYAGLTGYLLASASHDRGDAATALRQAEAAFAFAQRAEHPGLCALIRNIESLTAFWAGHYDEALRYANSGVVLTEHTAGIMSVLLPLRAARVLALTRRVSGAQQALRSAERRWQRHVADDVDDLLGYDNANVDPARLSYIAEVYMALPHDGQALRTGEHHAHAAVEAFADPSRPGWSYDRAAISQIYLSMARLGLGDPDGAADAIAPVLTLEPRKRTLDITSTLGLYRRKLRQHKAGAALDARIGALLVP